MDAKTARQHNIDAAQRETDARATHKLTTVHTLYANAVMHVCAGRDLYFTAKALDPFEDDTAYMQAERDIRQGYIPTFSQGTALLDTIIAHRQAGGSILYIEIRHNAKHIGTVSVWLDPEGDSIKYEAVWLAHA